MNELNDKMNGIIQIKDYRLWSHVKKVESYVKKYLHEKFPNDIIVQEFNRIDFVVLREELPVEIQSTIISTNSSGIIHSQFENSIRKQIEDNIENYGKCWFFFDSEYYRYLNATENPQISLNLDWFAKYVKESKLNVFVVRYDGEIKELKYEDLEFIRKLSSTCKIEYADDERVLNRNKIRILVKILDSNKFTQDEIDTFREIYKNLRDEKEHGLISFLKKQDDNRMKLYGHLLLSIGDLNVINDFLDMDKNFDKRGKNIAQHLGIVKIYKDRTKFVDKFDVCQYFPGYLRHKETWDSFKEEGFEKTTQGWRELFLVFHDKKQEKLDW